MDQLTLQYYKTLAKALGLSEQHFQLFQGIEALACNNSAIWNIYDTIPPKTINHLYNPGQFNNFSQNYGAMLNNLQGDNSNLQDLVTKGLLLYTAANNMYPYDVNLSDIQTALKKSEKSASVFLEYTPTFQSTARSFSRSSIHKNFDFFSKDGSYSILSNKLIGEKIQIKGNIDKFTTITGLPLSPNNTTRPSQKPWYNPGTMNLAFHNKNIWASGQPDWNATFSKKGNTQRFCLSLVVADGVYIQTTSVARFRSLKQTQLYGAIAQNGAFPFFIPKNTKNINQKLSFKKTGELNFSIAIPPGNPIILGVMVYSTREYLKFIRQINRK